jgi:NADH:ubiquinone oxidoreductase subunit 3 (subunit A)
MLSNPCVLKNSKMVAAFPASKADVGQAAGRNDELFYTTLLLFLVFPHRCHIKISVVVTMAIHVGVAAAIANFGINPLIGWGHRCCPGLIYSSV